MGKEFWSANHVYAGSEQLGKWMGMVGARYLTVINEWLNKEKKNGGEEKSPMQKNSKEIM